MDIQIASIKFFSGGDEDRFFSALSEFPAVSGFKGHGRDLIITIDVERADDVFLFEFAALLRRYRIRLSALACLADIESLQWMKDAELYWHKEMFGGSKG